MSLKSGDLVVLSERSRHYPGHELGYTGYTFVGHDPVVISRQDVVLYLGEKRNGYTILLKGDQKLFVYDLLRELVKYSG